MREYATPAADRRRAILGLLAEYHGLLTAQVAAYLEAEDETVRRDLRRMEAAAWVQGTAYPTDSTAGLPPTLWRLRQAGATEIGWTAFGPQYYRLPTLEQVQTRGAELTLRQAVTAAAPGDWQLLRPTRLPGRGQLTARTPQAIRLVAAVRAVEAAALAAGWATRTARWQSGAIEGYVPQRVNEYLAYRAANPAHCVLFLLPPVGTSRGWWIRTFTPVRGDPGRIPLFRDLAGVLPDRLAGLFPDAATLQSLINRLHDAGMQGGLVGKAGALLARIARESLPPGDRAE